MGAFQFRNTWYDLAPEWLTTGTAERYMYTLQLMSDALMEKATQAVTIRFPGLGDVSQLPYLAHDRQLTQGANESDAAFAERLSGAFAAWAEAGSRVAVLQQLQYVYQGCQPNAPSQAQLYATVGGYWPDVTTWGVVRQGDALGGVPALLTLTTANWAWNWLGQRQCAWLILAQYLAPVGLSGTGAGTTTASGLSVLADPGQTVSGVVVPAAYTTVSTGPWLTVTGLAGLTEAQSGQWITLAGMGHAANDGCYPIVDVLSTTSCVICNPAGVTSDSGGGTWSIAEYEWIGPALPWGAPGAIFGAGEVVAPPLDQGSNVQGVWQPTAVAAPNQGPSGAWGLDCAASVVDGVRALLQAWKSGPTWYVTILVPFDSGAGAALVSLSPLSQPGAGNPDGQMSDVGATVGGVVVPTNAGGGPWDAYCGGTGRYSACSVVNVT